MALRHDDDDIRDLIATLIETTGATVTNTGDPREGLNFLSTHPNIRMLITDIAMPNIDGIKLIEKLRSIPAFQALPIVVISGFRTPERYAKAQAAGVLKWLEKPFNDQQLLDNLQQELKLPG